MQPSPSVLILASVAFTPILSNQLHHCEQLLYSNSRWLRVSIQNIIMPVQGVLRDAVLKNLSSPSCLSLPQLDTLSLSNIMSSFLPSVKALSKAALTYSQIALLSSSSTVSGGSPEACSNPQTSCQNTSAVIDTCCFNAPGGQLLQVC